MLKPNILIADDSELGRAILVSMLEEEYNVYEAGDGLEAVRLLEEQPEFYQLLFLDLNMPKMDGYEVLKIMKEREWIKEVPVIIISSEAVDMGRLGAVDYFSKPFDREIVFTRIRNVLALYERYILDGLTGGLNTKGFIRQVKNFFRGSAVDKTEYEILFFDIKNFKAINELSGVPNGDLVLQIFYQNLCASKINPLAVARLESDHFVCLAKRQDDDYTYMEQLCDQKFEQNGKRLQMRIHCGIFHIQEKDMSVSGMIDRARMAESYRDDENTKPYTVYTSEMKAEYIDYAKISSELPQSMENGEFQVYFQPIMEAATGKLASAEALVRWIHPERGVVSPGVFIPVLEKDGNISKLDMYVLEKVRKFQLERKQQGKTMVPVSLNLSGIDFYDEEMMDRITEYAKSEEMPDWAMRLEITESSYAVMGNQCKERINEFRKHHVKILMDDFGSGYSSLGLLYQCDMDILKIDMSFVRQLSENAKARCIMRAIISLGHELGLKLVAEGVETAEQLEYLRSYGCDYIQGYYFSRPLPEGEFVKMLDQAQTAV